MDDLIKRIEKLEHDLAALQAYCDYELQERLRNLDGLVKELMGAMERLRVPRFPGGNPERETW